MSELYPIVVGIRFSKGTKAYHFDAMRIPDIQLGTFVLVETAKGRQVGEVVRIWRNMEHQGESLKLVEKIATAGELVSNETWNLRKVEALAYCAERAAELKIKDVKFLNAEFSYDGSYLLVTYSSSTEDKIDLKSLKYDLQRTFSVGNAEVKVIGPRDVAKIIGGMGACGIANRCCSAYLTDFSSISIKMAKEQGISLTPTEITGMCGRLRCCLEYENDFYVECRKKLPKKKKKVMTPQGEGKVVELFPLRNAVLVDIPEVGRREFPRDQITYDEPVKMNEDENSEGNNE